jgi:hypothetical protein
MKELQEARAILMIADRAVHEDGLEGMATRGWEAARRAAFERWNEAVRAFWAGRR